MRAQVRDAVVLDYYEIPDGDGLRSVAAVHGQFKSVRRTDCIRT